MLTGKDNYGKPKQDFADKIAAMTKEELLAACKQFIWLSAYADNNPRSDYHWQCDACADEAERRGEPAIYNQAHEYVSESLR